MSPILTEENYRVAIAALRQAFVECDPASLIKVSAPQDEYDQEIAAVLARARGAGDARALAVIIAKVLSESFDKEIKASDCLRVAEHSLRELLKIGLSL